MSISSQPPAENLSLWTAKVHPSLTGSGSLPANPVFRDGPGEESSPAAQELLEAFNTPVNYEMLDRMWFP